ncbi:uncharacterized protein LAJ45_04969 [Morchella importuna]|uniref:uncharacterized protein n=1 Tax=Morchella importuna TaxID=1174673 RepID=UPI001E8DCC85|nr:uncharacterized protein LAJ45_04969 [Morchella importuna]KAH8150788.1 hypothetical protein LAJ45_04969 [Morchella importuna]
MKVINTHGEAKALPADYIESFLSLRVYSISEGVSRVSPISPHNLLLRYQLRTPRGISGTVGAVPWLFFSHGVVLETAHGTWFSTHMSDEHEREGPI